MTAQSDHGHTGLDRSTNQSGDVNQEAKEGRRGGPEDPSAGDAMRQRREEITDK